LKQELVKEAVKQKPTYSAKDAPNMNNQIEHPADTFCNFICMPCCIAAANAFPMVVI
jgi:hypothetical protein